jgi:hypothetical protein
MSSKSTWTHRIAEVGGVRPEVASLGGVSVPFGMQGIFFDLSSTIPNSNEGKLPKMTQKGLMNSIDNLVLKARRTYSTASNIGLPFETSLYLFSCSWKFLGRPPY